MLFLNHDNFNANGRGSREGGTDVIALQYLYTLNLGNITLDLFEL